jgi:hypothetical protein
MMKTQTGDQLIRLLISDPEHFNGNDLLNEYFAGFPLDTLTPLLSSSNRMIRRSAIWIASELGKQGKPFLKNAAALLSDDDPFIRFYALDVLAVCSVGEDKRQYAQVVRSLEDPHDYLRAHAMFLMSNAEVSQLEATMQSFDSGNASDELHKIGISLLLAEQPTASAISMKIDSPQSLLRKYGVVAARRLRQKFPEMLSRIESSDDPDIKRFWEQIKR